MCGTFGDGHGGDLPVQHRARERGGRVDGREVLAGDAVRGGVAPGAVGIAHEAVVEEPQAFVQPDTHEPFRAHVAAAAGVGAHERL